jgi:hypothetical protein
MSEVCQCGWCPAKTPGQFSLQNDTTEVIVTYPHWVIVTAWSHLPVCATVMMEAANESCGNFRTVCGFLIRCCRVKCIYHQASHFKIPYMHNFAILHMAGDIYFYTFHWMNDEVLSCVVPQRSFLRTPAKNILTVTLMSPILMFLRKGIQYTMDGILSDDINKYLSLVSIY